MSEIKLELKVEQLELFREFRRAYNIAPSYGPGSEQAFVVHDRDGQRALRLGRWWMIPHFWQKPLKSLPAAFNARAEELNHKSFWRHAFREYRCLVPATGWREFKPEGKLKQPYQFRLERPLFAFAGLWSRWTSPDGELIDSFAIVTTAPNAQAQAYHDRMPLVLVPDLYEDWLAPRADAERLLLEARARAAELVLDVYPTDPRGNNVRFEGPEVVARLSPEEARMRQAERAQKPSRATSARPARATPTRATPAQQTLFAEPEPEPEPAAKRLAPTRGR